MLKSVVFRVVFECPIFCYIDYLRRYLRYHYAQDVLTLCAGTYGSEVSSIN